MKRLGYFLCFLLPLSTLLGYYIGGWGHILTILLVFLLIPLFDHLVGTREVHHSTDESKRLSEEKFYRNLLVLWAMVQTSFLYWAATVFPEINGFWEQTGFILGIGLSTGGIGITVAHELGHKKEALNRFIAKVLLMEVFYMHFYIEHNRGHHVWVGTPEDPATSRRNEGFYRFWVRSVFEGYLHAWRLEGESRKRNGKNVWSLGNPMIQFAILPVLFCLSLVGFEYLISNSVNISIAVMFFMQALVAFTLLELVNYVEHYGLTRRKLENGRYEPVTEFHSWNSDYILSNLFLFQLQLHSDHHMHAIKKYQTLDSWSGSPQLPFGYPTMILMALIPPLWYTRVNPILDQWEKDRETGFQQA